MKNKDGDTDQELAGCWPHNAMACNVNSLAEIWKFGLEKDIISVFNGTTSSSDFQCWGP